MSPQRPTQLALRWLALLVTPALVFLAALELILRVSGAEHAVARTVSDRLYHATAQAGGANGLFTTRTFDPVLSWRLEPNAWLPGKRGRINSHGFVGRDFDWGKRPGTTRVLSLGDSVTYGLWECGAAYFCHANPYPVALELLWKRTGRGAVEAIDAGVYGYSSLQGLRYYRTYLGSLDADIVTVMFGWNDHGNRTGNEGREPRNPVLRAGARGAAHLATYRTMAGLAALALVRDPAPPQLGQIGSHEPRVSLDDFAYHLEQLVELARERNAHVLFITQPVGREPATDGPQPWLLEAISGYDAWVALHDRYNNRVRAIGQELGVPVVDADAEFERRDKAALFSAFDLVHPNEAGHAVIAELVAERILREGWLSRPGR